MEDLSAHPLSESDKQRLLLNDMLDRICPISEELAPEAIDHLERFRLAVLNESGWVNLPITELEGAHFRLVGHEPPYDLRFQHPY